jgi:hypothetical protein
VYYVKLMVLDMVVRSVSYITAAPVSLHYYHHKVTSLFTMKELDFISPLPSFSLYLDFI